MKARPRARGSFPKARSVEAQLLRLARSYCRRVPEPARFSGDKSLDRYLNDIDRFPHLFVLGCVADYQVKFEKAWRVPMALAEHAGGKSFQAMCRMPQKKMRAVMKGPPALHRFPVAVADRIRKALDLIAEKYKGDASRIWLGRPSSALVVLRFLEFHGIGQKVSNMAANILARQFRVPFADRYSIDISVDVHVRRVMTRLGLVPPRASIEQVVYAARAVSPSYPGMLDKPCFDIGRKWCKPRRPLCGECPMGNCCPSAR